MTNLFQSAVEKLEEYGFFWDDVVFVQGDSGRSYTPEAFKEIATDINFHNGFGSVEVKDIKVVGHDWWLEWRDYDGLGGWVFQTMPKAETVLFGNADKSDFVY